MLSHMIMVVNCGSILQIISRNNSLEIDCELFLYLNFQEIVTKIVQFGEITLFW